MLVMFFVILSIPAVRALWVEIVFETLAPDEIPLTTSTSSGLWFAAWLLGNVPKLWQGAGPLLWPVHGMSRHADSYAVLSKGYEGPGLTLGMAAQGGMISLWRTSHDAIKEFTYDPNGPRQYSWVDIIPLANINETCTRSFFVDGTLPLSLQRNTNDPMYKAQRKLWSATIPALQRTEDSSAPGFEMPAVPGVESSFCSAVNSWNGKWSGILMGDATKWVPDAFDTVFKFNFFRQVFDVDITEKEILMLREWFTLFPNLNNGCKDSDAARAHEIQKLLMESILRGNVAKAVVAEADKEGMDSKAQLASTLVAFMAAGSSAPGGGQTAFQALKKLQQGKVFVDLYLKDPDAFILEVLRMEQGGGDQITFAQTKETTWTLGNGKVIKEPLGSPIITKMEAACYDPNIWGGPSKDPAYADKFIPGRENRERLLTFMNELQDIKKCSDMSGCDAAPRFCPGTFLAIRLARQAADLYVKKCAGATAGKDEM